MTTRRTRNNTRADATRLALIEQAEVLFADAGVDGVSLRQIGAAINSANTNVVAYHFGGKDALVQAILKYRLDAIEARRAELLARADAAGRGDDLASLIDALWRPFLEQTNGDGRHSYAAFILRVFASEHRALRRALDPLYPVTLELSQRMGKLCGIRQGEVVASRGLISLAMIVAALQYIDQNAANSAQAEAIFTDTLRMIEAAMQARPARAKPIKKRKT